jgi:hypothetical protein
MWAQNQVQVRWQCRTERKWLVACALKSRKKERGRDKGLKSEICCGEETSEGRTKEFRARDGHGLC